MPDDAAVVAAAQAGDRDALEELARRYLPLVYNLVRPVLRDETRTDDLVQDIMVRALRQLGDLRSPGSFRPWLTSIAVRQIGSHLLRERARGGRTVPLDEAPDRADAAAEIEGPSVLRAMLAGQRRQVRQATAWMGAEERTVLSLWWLELVGELTRADVAAGLGIGVAHAGVRIQRMREQLELSRGVVAALEAMPGCDRLGGVVATWDGRPSPSWRKRVARHVRSCPVCARATGDLVPADRLLPSLALLPVPIALAAVVAESLGRAGSAAPAVAAWAGRAWQAATAHPLVAVAGAGVLAVGVSVPATGWATAPQAAPAVAGAGPLRPGPAVPPPLASTGPLRPGPASLESAAVPGRYVAAAGDQGMLDEVGPASAAAERQRATYEVVAGLADPACVSLRESAGGRYLRHQSFRLRLDADEGTVLFRRDATFCARAGLAGDGISLESYNFRTFFLRRVGDQLWIDQSDGGAARADATFLARPPLA